MKKFQTVIKVLFRLTESVIGGYGLYHYFTVLMGDGKFTITDLLLIFLFFTMLFHGLYCIPCYYLKEEPESLTSCIFTSIGNLGKPTNRTHLDSIQRTQIQEFTDVFNNYNSRNRR